MGIAGARKVVLPYERKINKLDNLALKLYHIQAPIVVPKKSGRLSTLQKAKKALEVFQPMAVTRR